MNKNVLVVLSGPSGVGKGTIAEIIRKDLDFSLSISCTTRLPREKEINGREYFFISKEEFAKKLNSGGFLEYSEHFGNFYGTPKEFVINKLKEKDVLLEIDVNGGLSVKKNYPNAVLIMVIPPSLEELKSRLIKRHSETEQQINERLLRIEYELEKKQFYDYVVVNDDLTVAVNEIKNIISKEKFKENNYDT